MRTAMGYQLPRAASVAGPIVTFARTATPFVRRDTGLIVALAVDAPLTGR